VSAGPSSALVASVAEHLPTIDAGAAERDRDRTLPRAELDLLSSLGALAVTVPAAHGGPGGGAADAAELLRLLATVDPNVAQVPQSHFVYLRLAELAGSAALQERLFAAVLSGARVANAQSERGGATVTDIATRVRVDDQGWAVVDGEKFYATGSVLAHWLAVLARDHDGQDRIAFLPADTPGVGIIDDWDALGQRTTASGTVRLDAVRVPLDHLASRAEAISGPHGYGAFAQLLHAAIDVGIARGALTDAAAFTRSSSRPWFEAGVERAEEDPLLVQRYGELEVAVRAAEASLEAGARAVDATWREPSDAAATEASLAVAAAKVLADRAALDVTSAAFELGGTRSAARGTSTGTHDRHWRNARTHTLHDPVRWKLQHLGRWAVAGTPPPRSAQV
jgi:SfnB family sulfur acquisition oxidoreductase